MNSVTQTSLNSDAVQKLYEQRLSRGVGGGAKSSRQRGSGFLGGLIGNVAGNVVKAIDAGQRLAKMKTRQKRKVITNKRRCPRASGKMIGKGRRPSKGRKATTTTRSRKPKACIKTKRSTRGVTSGQKGGGVRRPRRRTVVRI